jgi:hypothetical protein
MNMSTTPQSSRLPQPGRPVPHVHRPLQPYTEIYCMPYLMLPSKSRISQSTLVCTTSPDTNQNETDARRLHLVFGRVKHPFT